MFLLIQPTWANRAPTDEEIRITNVLYKLFLKVFGGRQSVSRQVQHIRTTGKNQPVGLATGNAIDHLFKLEVEVAIKRAELPHTLQVTSSWKKGPAKGPDIWLERTAWDITLAEEGRAHVKRDVISDNFQWDVYFVLGY